MDNQKKSALVPFADLLNHNKPKQTSWLYDETKIGFSVKAMVSNIMIYIFNYLFIYDS